MRRTARLRRATRGRRRHGTPASAMSWRRTCRCVRPEASSALTTRNTAVSIRRCAVQTHKTSTQRQCVAKIAPEKCRLSRGARKHNIQSGTSGFVTASCGRRRVDSVWSVASAKKLDVVLILFAESHPTTPSSRDAARPTPSDATPTNASHQMETLTRRLRHALHKSGHVDVRLGLMTSSCAPGAPEGASLRTDVHTFNGYARTHARLPQVFLLV